MSDTLGTLPRPDETIQWRALDPADSGSLHGLIRELEQRDEALSRTSPSEAEVMLGRPGLAEAIAAFVADDPTPDAPIAFGYVGLARSGKPEAICHGGVLPEFRGRGIGQQLLDWQTERGTSLLNEVFPGVPGSIVHAVDARRTAFHRHLESLGYEWSHSFAELRHDLDAIPAPQGTSSFVEIVPWSGDWEEQVRKTLARQARLSGVAGDATDPQWAGPQGHPDPALSFLAIDRRGDRTRVAGLVEVGRYRDDWEALGWSEGYIDTVAAFDPDIRGEVLGALVTRALEAIKEAGLEKAAVGVNPQADPETMAFYDDIGFRPHAWWRHYARRAQAGPGAQES